MKKSKIIFGAILGYLLLLTPSFVAAQIGGGVAFPNNWRLLGGVNTTSYPVSAPYLTTTSSTATTTLAGGLVVDTNTLVADYSLNKVAITPIAGQVWSGLLNIMTSGTGVNSTGHLNLINSSAGDSLIRISTTGSNDTWWMGVDTSDSNKFKIAENPASGIGTADYLTISAGAGTDGLIGIGTTTPYAKLSITNTGTFPSFEVEDTASNDTTPFIIDANGLVGIGTELPTHSLTLGSTATGIVKYNTADQTTNYERVRSDYTSNEFWTLSEVGGSGTRRDIGIGYGTTGGTGGALKVQADALPYTAALAPFSNSTSNEGHIQIGYGAGGGSGMNASSGTQYWTTVKSLWNQTATAGGIDLYINRTETAIGSGQHDFLNMAIAGSSKARIDRTGHIFVDATNTAGGTTGNQTINKPSGTVNFAAAATAITVTNSTVSTASIILTNVRTNDATCTVKNAVPGSGSFVITMTAACTAETSVGFVVIN